VKITDDNCILLLINVINIFIEKDIKDIKLFKTYINNDDEFNFLYNKLKSLTIQNILVNLNEVTNKFDVLNK
jgi:hypothetical protein